MANKKKAKTPNIPRTTAQPSTSQVTANSAKPRQSARQRKQQRNLIWLLVAAALLTIGMVALIVINNRSQSQVSTPPVTSSLPAELVSGKTKGSPDAKVVVTQFSDFECPACKSFALSSEATLDEEYVKTGKVRFEYKHYPLPQHEPSATNAANAAECAADQGKFWEMHDYLFQEQGKQGTNTFSQIRLETMAKELGLNTSKFNSCLSNRTFAAQVQADVNEGRNLFVNATPTFFVNGQKVANPSLVDVKAAIDAALGQ
ncbi:MAG: DsbA family protein [Anaerolineae bacterium]